MTPPPFFQPTTPEFVLNVPDYPKTFAPVSFISFINTEERTPQPDPAVVYEEITDDIEDDGDICAMTEIMKFWTSRTWRTITMLRSAPNPKPQHFLRFWPKPES